jgi:sugar lactone lactonase YvrE
MRYFKFVICAAILLFVSGAVSAQQGIINNYAGGGPNDVPATSAPTVYPIAIAVDGSGNFYFTTNTTDEQRVFKVTPSGTMTVLAGSGPAGYAGDGGPATQAQLDYPDGLAIDHAGNVFISEFYNCAVREVNASTGIINTIAGIANAGCSYNGDSQPATSAYLSDPSMLAIDKNGNLFIADYGNQLIRMVACATVTSTGGACSPNAGQTSGDIYTVAGTGTPVFSGDGGLATSANLYNPNGVAVDTQGNLYIADYSDQLVRRVACGTGISGCTAPSGETSGHIYTLAGNGQSPGTPGTCGYNSDGITATSAELCNPESVRIDNAGNLIISDTYNLRIRVVSCATKTSSGGTCTPSTGQTTGKIYTVVGNGSGGYNGDNQPATSATIYYPTDVAVDPAGDLFISDYDNWLIREVPCDVSTLTCTPPAGDTAQYIYSVAGNGTDNFFGNDIAVTGAILNNPVGTVSDSSGNIYIADRNNCVVREVNAITGIITTFAGTPGTCSYTGDSGPATSADLYYPYHLGVDSSNNIYITDQYNCVIREVSGGNINTVAGNGTCGGALGDGGPATSASLYYPSGVAVDSSGNMYIADYDNYVVRKVNSSGIILEFAGTVGSAAFSGDGGPGTSAQLYYPTDVAVDAAGNVYIADQYNLRIRKVNTLGIISTYAGNGAGGFQGDGGPANETSLYYPYSVAVDTAGDVLIADFSNQRVRLVDGAGNIHTVAGTGIYGYFGDGVPASTALVAEPQGVGFDPTGNIYISDTNNDLVRQVSALAELNGSPSSLVFNTQLTGTTSGPVTLTLVSAGPVTITSITPSANFSEQDDCGGGLSNGQTCTVDVYFSPSTAGIINGTLTIADNAFFNKTLVVNLQGTATDLTITPNPLAFGVVTDGSPVTDLVTVAGNTTYAGTSATLTGDTTDYSIASNTCSGHVTSSCAIGIKFNPGSAGTHNATLAIHDSDPTSAQLVQISGSGCVSDCSSAYETFTPTSILFPAQPKGVSSAATKVTFTNNNTSSLTITKPVATAGFKVNITGLTAPICSVTASTVVAAGGTCSFNVVFDPTATGSATGTVKTTFPNDGHGNVGLTLNVSGEGSATSFTPSPVAIKATMINTTSAKTKVTLKNVDTVSITLSSLVSSAPATFVLSNTGLSPACSLTSTTAIAAGATCVFDVPFAPGATFGTINGTITANYTNDPNGDTSHVLNVSGIGTEMKETGALAFGTVTNPNVSVKSVTVTNEGTTSSTITAPSITGTGAAECSVLPYNGTNSTCLNGTVVLGHLNTCTLTVQFTPPTGSGTSYAADLNINSTGGGPVVVAISGKN